MKHLLSILSLILAFGFPFSQAQADEKLDPAIVQLQHDWARVNYQVGKEGQEAAFKALADQAHQVTASSPNQAEAMIWEAIERAPGRERHDDFYRMLRIRSCGDRRQDKSPNADCDERCAGQSHDNFLP